jgi:hypothetical protein
LSRVSADEAHWCPAVDFHLDLPANGPLALRLDGEEDRDPGVDPIVQRKDADKARARELRRDGPEVASSTVWSVP